jgi:hypothetical protein
MPPTLRSRAVLVCAVLLALAGFFAWPAGEDAGPARSAPSPLAAARGTPRDAGATRPPDPGRRPAAPASARLAPATLRDVAPAAPRERALLARALAEALPGVRSARDLDRLAELVLAARDLRGREAPARERDILLALSLEFERLAGAPMGDVISRLARPGELAPERARRADAEAAP